MCASYGLGGGPYEPDDRYGMDPLDARESRRLIDEWMHDWGGKAGTSRDTKRGVNLNPIIRADAAGNRSLELAWWWFHVGGQPAKFTAFNSRDDALTTKWKTGFQHRALLPADWYSEGGKQWTLPDGQLFAIAAITSPRTADGVEIPSYSMVTREAVGEARSVTTARGDHRMPLVLPVELHDAWLDPERPGDIKFVREVQAKSEEISQAMTAGGLF